MKNSTFMILVFVSVGFELHAQKFTVIPQIGLENPLTKITYNNLPALKPLQSQLSPSLGLRLDYKLNKWIAPFIGLSTSRSTVAYSFSNPETGMNIYTASAGKMELQLQAGWQASTKRIYFKKASQKKQNFTQNRPSSFSRCGAYRAMGHCGTGNRFNPYKAPKNKSWFVRIMPSAGLALNPFAQSNTSSKMEGGQITSTYNAGNFKTALLTGVGFEFGSNQKRHFTININYFKGLGSNAGSIITESGAKTVTTNITSKVSGWNASVGIPFSLGKKPVSRQTEKKKCEYRQYGSCRRII